MSAVTFRNTPWKNGATSNTMATFARPPRIIHVTLRFISILRFSHPLPPKPLLSLSAGVGEGGTLGGRGSKRFFRPRPHQLHQLLLRPHLGHTRLQVNRLQPVGAGKTGINAAQRNRHIHELLVTGFDTTFVLWHNFSFPFLFCLFCFVFSVPANDRFANSFLATVTWLVRADVNHNSRPAFPRGLRRRAWTETFADSGRCKSRTSFHRVWRGEQRLRPRSFQI